MTPSATYLRRLITAVFLAAYEAMAQDAAGGERRIVVSLAERRLYLIVDGRLARAYPVAVGAPESPSPEGAFRIANLVDSPAWYPRGRVVRPGPGNPLGPRWIGLSQKGYGIHGTNHPRSIGQVKSRGCIRMRNQDVKELFAAVAVGDMVELRAGPVEEAAWY
jgi:lipoprotein-anchoring transpeptidase ErfK/SrfK